MDILILAVLLVILAETTILLSKNHIPKLGKARKIFIDTSILIDGRILNLAKTGFLKGDYIVLRSVLRELQLLADSKDNEKRTRARAGLKIVTELEHIANVRIPDDGDEEVKVDEQLLKYAREQKGAIMTLDYNLMKVAEAEKIAILNINELSMALRTEFLPGEKIQLKIVDRGTNRGQGVGHLKDGTMVVVDKASTKIGETVTVEFVRFLENSAGKIVFARLAK